MKMVFVPNRDVRDSLSGLRVQQFRQAVLAVRYWVQTSIFVRKTLSVRPEKSEKAKPFTSSMEGPAFFDEDDVCNGCLISKQPI